MKHILYTLLFLLLTQVCSNSTSAQEKWAGWGVESNFSTGKIFRHSENFPTILPKNITSYEVNILYQTHGTRDWHSRRGYPLMGFGFTYTDYGIDSIYGKCLGIYPNIQIPLVKYKDFEWTIKAGFGLGFMTKRYERHPSFDTINTAIGSRLNNFSLFSTDLRYRINEHIDVQVGCNFSHVSNASLRAPNLGINAFGAHLGVRYFPTTSQPEKARQNPRPLSNRWLIQGRVGIAGKEGAVPDGPMYRVLLLSAYASKRYWSKNKIILGVDYSYHPNVTAFLKNNEIAPGKEKDNAWTSAIIIGNEFLIGRAGILFQIGAYLKTTYLQNRFMYQKLGGNYYIIQREEGTLKELNVYIHLKTHTSEAELVEVGLGFGL